MGVKIRCLACGREYLVKAELIPVCLHCGLSMFVTVDDPKVPWALSADDRLLLASHQTEVEKGKIP